VAGARLEYLSLVAMVGIGIAAWLDRFREYRWERMLAWFNMAEHRQDLAYQPFQSVMSFGSGGFSGLGLGQGYQVLYLPEAHTDFIAAIIGEELGFVGLVLLVMAFLTLVVRGVRAALLAEDEYGGYIAFGISLLFGLQALINLAVAMAMLPTKGLTLPFISYGGSSLLVNCAAAGVLLNISRPVVLAGNRRAVAPEHTESSALVASGSDFGAAERGRSRTVEVPS
jgi:cell division protein FtsW